MGKITDKNIVKKGTATFARDIGTAHEYLVTGILMRLGFDVSVASLAAQPYDLIVEAYSDFEKDERRMLLGQVKTISEKGSLRFTGGGRAGVDREYKSDVKTYKYTPEHNDLIIGVDQNTLELYLVPTKFLELWGTSKSISKLKPFKNNWDILLNWNDEYHKDLRKKIGANKKPESLKKWISKLFNW